MNTVKARRILVNLHLIFAGLMAPAFLLVAVSGGLYLLNIKGTTTDTPVALADGAALDFKSGTIEADVRALLLRSDIDHDFEYIRDRGSTIELRPTSRTYLSLSQTPDGLSATRHVPDLQKSMMELHKGHGPTLFKLYQKFVAILLIGVVFGGVLVGLLAKAYRGKTIICLAMGTVLFLFLALFA
ncbi:MAG: PepSY-associated TM helix domain-containing protein [Litorimonas sp.]